MNACGLLRECAQLNSVGVPADEYYEMITWCCDNILDTPAYFKSTFADPIAKGECTVSQSPAAITLWETS